MMTGVSVIARAAAMAAPLPVLYAYFSLEMVAFWLLLITFQAIIGGLSGSLPTIAMQMLSYAQAGSKRLVGSSEQHQSDSLDSPNEAMKANLNFELRRVYNILTGLWFSGAVILGTLVIWRSLETLSDMTQGLLMWVAFLLLSAVRLKLQPMMAYLFAVGKTAKARRTEAIAWALSAILTPIGLWVTQNALIGIVLLYAPLVIQFFVIKIMAIQNGATYRKAAAEKSSETSISWLIWQRAWRGTVGTLAGMFTIYGSGFILAQYADPLELSGYLLALNVVGFMQQFAMAPLYGAMPAMAALYAKSDLPKLRELFDIVIRKSTWVFALLMVPVPACIFLANSVGIELSFVSPLIWLLMFISISIVRYGAIHLHFFAVTNEIKLHIANGLFAFLFLVPLAFLDKPDLILYPVLQGLAAIFYAAYAKNLTARECGYGLTRDVPATAIPIAMASLLILGQVYLLS